MTGIAKNPENFQVETTWGQLRKSDGVLDKDGKTWTVTSDPDRIESSQWGKAAPEVMYVRLGIKHDRTQTVVTKLHDEAVTVVQYNADRPIREELRSEYVRVTEQTPDEVLDEASQVLAENIQDAFGDDKVELLATETDSEAEAREAATEDRPVVLPILESPFHLRAHLYIFHQFYVAGESNGLALKEHHRKCHSNPEFDRGNPHVHEEAT